jgi:AcrR family transcriptional regulator
LGPRAETGAARARNAVKTKAQQDKPRVRDRILDTACELFYQHGIHAVGVDAIASEAGTNKMSLYRNFASKEELVAEYLREQEREYWQFWDETVAPHDGDPRRQAEALFEAFLSRAKSKSNDAQTCRGCALGNAAVEIAEEDETLRGIVQGYKAEIRRRLRKLAREMGARDPEVLGDSLMLLLEGGYYTRLVFSSGGPVGSVVKAARTLIEAHGVPPPKRR